MKTSKILAAVSSVSMGMLTASSAYAVDSSNPLGLISNVQGTNTELMTLVTNLINWAVGLAALVCVVILIVSGYKYITASGDENKIQSATKTLTFAIIGLVVCFIAVILVKFVLQRIGVTA